MKVLKVVAEGITTSFRYPHFMQGIHMTYEMPPPATIYGHICSTIGEWVDPANIKFAVHFTFQGRFSDLEHTYILKPATGNLKDIKLPKVLEGEMNPFTRSILFRPRLTLYLNRPDWIEHFRSPRYPVCLGRSQDLFTYTLVKNIELKQSEHAYFEHTLAPYNLLRKTAQGIVVTMPRFLDYNRYRFPVFEQYIIFHRRIHTRELLRYADEEPPRYFIDPESPEIEGDFLGLFFHSWVDEDGSSL